MSEHVVTCLSELTYPIRFDGGSWNGVIDAESNTLEAIGSNGHIGDVKPVLWMVSIAHPSILQLQTSRVTPVYGT